jgi:hypothetical protein
MGKLNSQAPVGSSNWQLNIKLAIKIIRKPQKPNRKALSQTG